jgi:hypothetical protein
MNREDRLPSTKGLWWGVGVHAENSKESRLPAIRLIGAIEGRRLSDC